MRTLLRSLFRSRTWEQPIDTRLARYAALDWAIFNVDISTRFERNETPLPPDTLVGDYLEFGVYRGNTFVHAHHRARERMPFMRFFAFDSFAGLPPIAGHDQGGEFKQGQFACSRAEFTSILEQNSVDLSRVRIVEGWYDESLTDELRARQALEVCAIAFIDCDLYASAVPVLRFLTSLVRRGTILLFDDWYNFRADPHKGVQRATREWLQRNPELRLEKWYPFCHHGQSFIVQIAGDEDRGAPQT